MNNIIKKILVGCMAVFVFGFACVIGYVLGVLLNSGNFDDLTQGILISGGLFALNSALAGYGCYTLWKRVSA